MGEAPPGPCNINTHTHTHWRSPKLANVAIKSRRTVTSSSSSRRGSFTTGVNNFVREARRRAGGGGVRNTCAKSAPKSLGCSFCTLAGQKRTGGEVELSEPRPMGRPTLGSSPLRLFRVCERDRMRGDGGGDYIMEILRFVLQSKLVNCTYKPEPVSGSIPGYGFFFVWLLMDVSSIRVAFSIINTNS